MAGEELDKNTPVAKEAKATVVDPGQNKSLSDRFGQDYVDRVKEDGMQDSTNNGYSRKELASEFRYGRGDTSVDDTASKFQGMVDSGEFKGNNKAQEFLKMHGVNFGKEDKKEDKKESEQMVPTVKPDAQTSTVADSGSQNNATNNSTINGNNNSVDQSITQTVNNDRTYGGTNKSFTYNGSSNQDAPVSAGTMAGHFYDGDSPSKSAAFLDRYTTMNDDYQSKYKGSNTAQNAINAASKNEAVDINALDQKINDRASASRARSTVMAGDIFGDMFNFRPSEWRNADKMDEVETPDFKKLAEI